MPTKHSSRTTKSGAARSTGTLVDQLMKSLSRSIGGGLALTQIAKAVEEAVVGEWKVLQSLGKLIAKEINEYTPTLHLALEKCAGELAEIVPTLTQAVETLASVEHRLLEITGIKAPSPGGVSPVADQLHALRDRVNQWNSDAKELREFRLNRDLNQTIDTAIATLRFIVGAIAIIRIGLQIAEQLNPKKVINEARRSNPGASANV